MNDYFFSLEMLLCIHGQYDKLLYTGIFEYLSNENNL